MVSKREKSALMDVSETTCSQLIEKKEDGYQLLSLHIYKSSENKINTFVCASVQIRIVLRFLLLIVNRNLSETAVFFTVALLISYLLSCCKQRSHKRNLSSDVNRVVFSA